VNGSLLFTIATGTSPCPYTRWCTDGSTAGTFPITAFSNYSLGDSQMPVPCDYQGSLYFYTVNETSGSFELWKTDGTRAGTRNVQLCGTDKNLLTFFPLNGMLYFIDSRDQLVVKDMQSGKRERVFQDLSKLLYNGNGWALNYTRKDGRPVFEAYRYADRTLRTVPLDESILNSFADDSLFYVLGFDGKYLYLCFNGYEYAATFYQVDAANGKAVRKMKADQYAAQCVSGTVCYAFTGTYSDGGAPRNLNVWACDMARGTKALMARLSTKTGMVDEMAYAGGYVWGFGSTEKKLAGGDSLYLTKYLFALPVKGGN
jgi:hypothetical protein